MHVFLTGGTGLIGTRLIREFCRRGDRVTVLTRRPAVAQGLQGPACTLLAGDPTQPGPWADAVADCDAVVNLAGENLFSKRWSAAFKQVLRDSRIRSTENVALALARRPTNAAGEPKILVNASAVGFYGARGDEELNEDSPPGSDYLAGLCVEWEQAARRAESFGVRVVVVRIGVVLAADGGALKQMLPQFRAGMGGPVGSGKQWVSWVHVGDVTRILQLVLDNPAARGPLNAMSPNPVRNQEFAKTLGRVLQRPSVITTPAFAVRLMLGEVAEVVLTGQRVRPTRLPALGYAYQFSTLEPALTDLLKGDA
jgi:uncharacterized protein (TIGR01777 family)